MLDATESQRAARRRIMATMLGRLDMTVDDCIKAYRKVGERAFTPKPTTG